MLLIDEAHRPHFAALGWTDAGVVLARLGTPVSGSRPNVVVRELTLPSLTGPGIPVFFKTYDYPQPTLAFFGRASKARCEFQHYEVFTRLGVRCAQRVACGEERDRLGRLQRAFIITRTIPSAMTLIDFSDRHQLHKATPENRSLRHRVLAQLATMTRSIHDAGFYHEDLVWRNILVTMTPGGEPLVWWIDCPRGRFDRWSPWKHHKQIKDLASLDKCASKFCSRPERMQFLNAYLHEEHPSAACKALAREVSTYRQQRWPSDWNGK